MSNSASNLSRRDLLKFGGLSAVGALGLGALAGCSPKVVAPEGGVPNPGGSLASTGTADGVPSFLLTPEPITDFAETYEYDVVVVGAGESGLGGHPLRFGRRRHRRSAPEPAHGADRGQHGAPPSISSKTSEAGIKAAVSYINYKSDYRINTGQVEAWARNSQEALAWWEEAAKAGGKRIQALRLHCHLQRP